MELIADGVLILAALAATAYCMVLSRRLRRLSEMDGGLGAAIKALSSEVDHLSSALAEAKLATSESATDLGAQCRAANVAARRLETLVKSANRAELQRQPIAETASEAISSKSVASDKFEIKETTDLEGPDGAPERATTTEQPQAEPAPTLQEPLKAQATLPTKPEYEPDSETQITKDVAAAEKAPESAPAPVAKKENPDADASAIDDFIGAIIAKADAGENAALARRLVLALSNAQSEQGS